MNAVLTYTYKQSSIKT